MIGLDFVSSAEAKLSIFSDFMGFHEKTTTTTKYDTNIYFSRMLIESKAIGLKDDFKILTTSLVLTI